MIATHQKYAGMMVDVQKTQLLEPFLSYNEKCVQEIENLRKVEDV